MHGASLLYNLMLSEMRQNEEWIEDYRDALSNWANEMDPIVVASWSLDDFWQRIEHEDHRVRAPARPPLAGTDRARCCTGPRPDCSPRTRPDARVPP